MARQDRSLGGLLDAVERPPVASVKSSDGSLVVCMLEERMAVQRFPAFLGRTSEREVLDRLLDSVRGGPSGALVIRGEAGVGKTALLQYTARQASGFRVAEIAGVESEMELAFGGLHQLCAPMVARLDRLPEPQRAALNVAFGQSSGGAPDRFLVALATLSLLAVAAEERPLLCLVDDAHWLDSASVQVLGIVARRLLAESVAIVFAVRQPSVERELVGLPQLSLGELDMEDARALLGAAIPGPLDERVRDRIVAETRGNPLALLELPRGMTAAELAGGFMLPDRGGISDRLEEHYMRRHASLPEATQRLMLLAAADPVGDATLIWRAAHLLGIERQAAEPAATEQLLEIGTQVRFRHPLVRSASYRSASVQERQHVHAALAQVTDPKTDPDRRAWHRAHATTAPDEEVAGELIRSASRAEARGGIAAAAAFLDRAVAFTPDPTERASRALSAAQAKFAAGDLAAAESLLVTAEVGPLDELAQARVQRMSAQIAFDLRRGRDAPPLLLRAAQRLAPLEAELARETYLEALVAAIYAAGLANGTSVADVARAARSATLGPEPLPARQLLLLALATRLTDGYAAAAPTLTEAVRAYRAEGQKLDWLSVAYNIAAMELWDDEAWLDLASSQAQQARATGTLSMLPYALDYLAEYYIQAGELTLAAGVLTEAEGLAPGIRAQTLPYVPLLLAAWRGHRSTVLNLSEVMNRGAQARGEGCAITVASTRRQSCITVLASTNLRSRRHRKRPRQTRSPFHPGRSMSWSRPRHGLATSRWHTERWIAWRNAPAQAAPTGRGEPSPARVRSSRRVKQPKSVTGRRSSSFADVGCGHILRVLGCRTASGCVARTAVLTRASSYTTRMSCLPQWVQTDSPSARDTSCSPQGSGCASEETICAISSRPRRSTSRDWPVTDGPIQKLAPSCISATARSSGTCERYSPSWVSAHAKSCTAHCRGAGGQHCTYPGCAARVANKPSG